MKLTTEEFIERAKLKHGDKYDYSKVAYVKSSSKVKIKCKEHGVFNQSPNHHLKGKGCILCAGVNKRTTSSFIKKSKQIHGDRYDYSLVNYKNSQSDVAIICSEHGVFYQMANSHVQGRGCSKCKNTNKRISTVEFVRLARVVHGDKYDYSMSSYTNSISKIKIICNKHGEFYQSPKCHLNSRGCPNCSINGYKTYEEGCLYVLRSECGLFVKIGISNIIKTRISNLKRSTPFNFIQIECFSGCGKVIKDMESKFHKVFDNAGFKGFDGATEWFHYDSEKLQQLINYGESINEN